MPAETKDRSVLDAIYQRRSVRHFADTPVDREAVLEAVKAASWAPSGLNNQPWRFAIVWDREVKDRIAGLTRYATTIRAASVLVVTFLDHDASYDYTKDCQAVGAALQNMLLALHGQGLGAVWIGEILKNRDQVRTVLGLPERLELMAVVAIGHPAHTRQRSQRRPVEELIVYEH